MIKIKSYQKIWNVEGTLYSVGDTNLPFPVTYSQILWFVGSLILMFFIGGFIPVDNFLIKYVALPVGLTYLMSKVEFNGKKPLNFFLSYVSYFFRPKKTYRGKAVVSKKKHRVNQEITIVRSVNCGISN